MKPLVIIGWSLAWIVAAPASAWEQLNRPVDGLCSFVQQFDGAGTTGLMVRQSQQQSDNGDYVQIIVSNQDWSLKPGAPISDRIAISSETMEFSTTHADATDHGFSIILKHDELSQFANALPSVLTITKGDTIIDRLDLSGFYSAWLGFESCRSQKAPG